MIYHKISHSPASYILNGGNINIVLKLSNKHGKHTIIWVFTMHIWHITDKLHLSAVLI